MAVGDDGDPARAHSLERRVELVGVEQRAIPGQQRHAACAERLGPDDAESRRLRVAAVLRLAKTSIGVAVRLRVAQRDSLGAPLAR